jgi:signal transduction histidine kinase
MALLMVLVGVPMWYFVHHLERDEELKRLNSGLQVRTEELAAVNESLVTEVSERKRTEQSLEASRRDLRQLAAQLLRVQEEERQRIARDLHDDINQRLALLTIDVEALERRLSMAPIDTLRAVRAIEDRVIELSDDVRHLAHQLHPSILNDLGLSIALQRLVDDFTARTGVQGDFIDQDSLTIRDQKVSTCLYRVAQESLMNVSRHAKAKHVQIDLARLRNGLRLMIKDDGVGFDRDCQRDKREGLGLLSMRERVALVGGTLDIESVEGEGTGVCVWVPLEKQE